MQVFPRYSVNIYKCTNASELKSQQESMWVAKIMNHSSTCSYLASPFLATGVFHYHWGLVGDINRWKCILYLCGEGIALGHYHPPPARFFGTFFAGPYCIFYRSHTLRIDAADLHVICYSVNCATAKILVCLPSDFYGLVSPGAGLFFTWRMMA